MNQRAYDHLSPELQAVINGHSGMAWAENAGEVFGRLDREGKAKAVEAGHISLGIDNPLENVDWEQPLKKSSSST